jgi:hypothetical protein
MKYKIGQFVRWKAPDESGDGIIRGMAGGDGGGIVYLVGNCWVDEEFIDAALDSAGQSANP